MRPSGLAARGLTLIELMMGVSLLSVVALGFGTVYGTAQTSLVEAMARDHADRGLSHAMEHLTRHLRQASTAEWKVKSGEVDVYELMLIVRKRDLSDPIDTNVYQWDKGAKTLEWMPEVPAGQLARTILVANGIEQMQVVGNDPQDANAKPEPTMTARSAVAIVTLKADGPRGPIQRTASVQLRGWTPPVN